MVSLFLLAALLLQLFQYTTMQQTIEVTTIEAARQIASHLPAESTILAGPYALPLALESQIPAIWMLGSDKEAFLNTQFTHLVVDSAGPYAARYFTETQLRDEMPELFDNAALVQTYVVRGYTVHVFEVK